MELDPATLLRASIGLLTFAALVWIAQRISRPATGKCCPSCGGELGAPTDQGQSASCPRCHSDQVQSSSQEVVPVAEVLPWHNAACRACGQLLTESVTVPLWDGANYCEICVAEKDATLPEYALRHTTLTATRRFSFWRAVSAGLYTATTLAVGLLMVAILLLAVVWMQDQLPPLRRPPRQIALFAARMLTIGWCTLAAITTISSLFVQWFAYPRTIAVRHGKCLISPPGERLLPLQDLLWAEASTRYDVVDGGSWPRRKGVVLFTKAKKRRSAGYLVGETDEDRQRWSAFLTLAGVRRQPIAPWRQVIVGEQASKVEQDVTSLATSPGR